MQRPFSGKTDGDFGRQQTMRRFWFCRCETFLSIDSLLTRFIAFIEKNWWRPEDVSHFQKVTQTWLRGSNSKSWFSGQLKWSFLTQKGKNTFNWKLYCSVGEHFAAAFLPEKGKNSVPNRNNLNPLSFPINVIFSHKLHDERNSWFDLVKWSSSRLMHDVCQPSGGIMLVSLPKHQTWWETIKKYFSDWKP